MFSMQVRCQLSEYAHQGPVVDGDAQGGRDIIDTIIYSTAGIEGQ